MGCVAVPLLKKIPMKSMIGVDVNVALASACVGITNGGAAAGLVAAAGATRPAAIWRCPGVLGPVGDSGGGAAVVTPSHPKAPDAFPTVAAGRGARMTGVAVTGVAASRTDSYGPVVFDTGVSVMSGAGTDAEARARDPGVGVDAAAPAGPRLLAWMEAPDDPAPSEEPAPSEDPRDPGEPPSAAATGIEAIAAPTPRATANAPT